MSSGKIQAKTTTTISQVLARFLAEQQRKLAARTFSQYRSAVELFQHGLNSYGPNGLEAVGVKR